MDKLNIAENRAAKKYPLRVQLRRVAWAIGGVAFRMVPRPFYGVRSLILKLFGAKVGRSVQVARTARIYFPWNLEIGDWSSIGEYAFIYNLGQVQIGKQATVSQRSHLCAGTHDFTDPATPLLTPPIHVGDQAWICADAFVGPGVTVGEGAVVGARAVVIKDVEPWNVVAGNPAKFIKLREIKT